MSWAIWITGPPGSGKSGVARAVAAELLAHDAIVVVLELDVIRKTLTPTPTYSDTERDIVDRTLVYMASLLTESGVPVLIDAPVENAASAARSILPVALGLARAAGRRRGAAASWAMWITGLPGSGKTTLAASVAQRLMASGVPVSLLDVAELRRFVVPAGFAGAPAEEVVHRALVCAAKALTDAGVPVIIDATAPRRRWRQMARDLIAHYAEVQLVCPFEICNERERAVRWNLSFYAHGARPKTLASDGPDIVLDYELSLDPDLTVHTNVRDVSSAAEEILQLAHRLHRAATGSTASGAR